MVKLSPGYKKNQDGNLKVKRFSVEINAKQNKQCYHAVTNSNPQILLAIHNRSFFPLKFAIGQDDPPESHSVSEAIH
jgi:hypothetical protein